MQMKQGRDRQAMSQKSRNVEPSGTPVATVRVGESIRYADGSGRNEEHTNWHSLSFDRKGRRHRPESREKATNVYVDGRIQQRQFTPA